MEAQEQVSVFLDKGSFGCAFSPPLPCKRRKTLLGRRVGKVLKKRDAEIELSMAELIRGIPGWSRYFLIQETDSCAERNFARLRKDYEAQCRIYKVTPDDALTQLLSPYGGSTFHSIAFSGSFDFMGALQHMLEAIEKLQSQGICHYDITERNVLVDANGVFRIIDFGSAFQPDYLTERSIWRHIYSFSPAYSTQPPELSVQNGLIDSKNLTYCVNHTIEIKREFKLMQTYLNIPVEEQRKNLLTFWQEDQTYNAAQQTWIPFFQTYWNRWDSWAVGVLFLKLLNRLFLTPTFQRLTWQPHSEKIRKILGGLLHANPMKRYTASQALIEFNKLK
jgi:serine/threonine protein kinase